MMAGRPGQERTGAAEEQRLRDQSAHDNGTARLTAAQRSALAHARHLAGNGVPLFLARPDGDGFRLPKGWQRTEPDPAVVDRWRPGMALCAVMGHTVDAVDVDPRNGGDRAALNGTMPRTYGRQATPSGGTHDLVAALGVGSRDGFLPGVDLKGGRPDGTGRGFIFIAPTERADKGTGQVKPYRWTEPPALDDLALIGGDESGTALAARVRREREQEPPPAPEPREPAKPERVEHVRADVAWTLAKLDALAELTEYDRTEWPGVGEVGWDMGTFLAAERLVQAANADVGYTLDDAEADFMEHAPPSEGTYDRAHKWRQGVKAAGNAATPHRPTAADDFADVPNDLFEATPVLRHIHQAARARLVSPAGLLVYTLARVLANVPPEVRLPPVVGSAASLNLGVAGVSASGGGKSATTAVSRELFDDSQDVIEREVGSGEGLVQTFLRWDSQKKENVLDALPHRIILVDEIAALGASQRRSGSTIAPTLRSALTGDALGQENADPTRRRRVPRGRYRLVMLAGVQPTRSDALLDDTDAGTPQRFVWVPLEDPDVPDQEPEWPGPLEWEEPSYKRLENGWIDYPDHIKEEVRDVRREQLRGNRTAAEGHLVLTRLKVAAALALLHGEARITDEWWLLAGKVIDVSVATQDYCRRVLGEDSQRRRSDAAVAEARAVDHAEEDRLTRAIQSVRNAVKKAGGEWVTRNNARPGTKALREYTDDAIDHLRRGGEIETEEYERNGVQSLRLRWVGGAR